MLDWRFEVEKIILAGVPLVCLIGIALADFNNIAIWIFEPGGFPAGYKITEIQWPQSYLGRASHGLHGGVDVGYLKGKVPDTYIMRSVVRCYRHARILGIGPEQLQINGLIVFQENDLIITAQWNYPPPAKSKMITIKLFGSGRICAGQRDV
jgi:hypothetical protein